MATSKKLKDLLNREIELLGEARDELKKQLKVGKGEAKKEWALLETKWKAVQGEIKRIGLKSEAPTKDIESAARKLMTELKKGYGRIKRQVEK